MENNKYGKKFLLFIIEIMQAGVALTKQEMEIVYNAAEKLEGFDDDSFKNIDENEMNRVATRLSVTLNKRKNFIESCTFNLLSKESIEELSEKEDLTEHVMRAKRIAAKMADEFLESDEKLEKVVTDGRRLIEHFIDQWKKMPLEEEKQEPKKDYEPESDAEIIDNV